MAIYTVQTVYTCTFIMQYVSEEVHMDAILILASIFKKRVSIRPPAESVC